MNGMRKHELLLLQQLLLAEITQEDYRKLLAKAGCYVDEARNYVPKRMGLNL